ncbi:hypothetical protein [Streptomyces anulatus]|uniref:hypothetical protein n=1 Tax=Streptomyces anulatus TaxID=1892 RepID=UPI00371F66A6
MITALSPSELGAEVMRLVDDQKVTQSSIVSALGMHRSQLSAKIQTTAFALILYLCDGAQDQSKAAVR